jgi:hypothetical protein
MSKLGRRILNGLRLYAESLAKETAVKIDLVNEAYEAVVKSIASETRGMDLEDRAAVLAKLSIEINGQLDDVEDELDD